MIKIILLCTCCLFSYLASACPVYFHIVNKSGNNMPNLNINIDGIYLGKTDSLGLFHFYIENGRHNASIETDSTILEQRTIQINCSKENRFEFIIERNNNKTITLNEVSVNAKSALYNVKLSPFSVQAIDAKKLHERSGDVGEILTRASGIKVRTDGSVGGTVQINLGGLQGKAVRIFRDGIPIEIFGHAFNLTTISANMLDRMEIYKGITPIYLASDALGGGINLVTRQDNLNFAEISYEYGSFNTHRTTLSGLWINKSKKWYLGTNSSFNYSDNNYKVNVPITKGSNDYHDIKRFHDAVRTYHSEIFVGLKNKNWVDDLRLTLINSSFFKELQSDAQMSESYGQAFSKEDNITTILNYKKRFLAEKLNINGTGIYSHFNTKFIDTATTRYDWSGNIIAKNQRPGEFNLGNNQRIDYDFLFSRLNISYNLSENHILDFSQMNQTQKRKGNDPLGAISPIDGIDVLTYPAHYRKNVVALGLRSNWLAPSLETVVALKHYKFSSKGYTTDNTGTGFLTTTDQQNIGYLGGIRWSKGKYLVKLSYERATRLPDEYEVFGDAVVIKENLGLKPERSHNINLSGEYSIHGSSGQALTLSGGLFYRKVKDGIFFQLDIPFNRFINYDQTKVKGFELEANYSPVKRFTMGANITYQDIRQINIKDAIFNYLEGSRVPNLPFFFGNSWFTSYFNDLVRKGDKVTLNWNINYTHRFFLYAIPKSQEPSLFQKTSNVQTSLVIPGDSRLGQFTNNAGVTYNFARPKISLAVECKNIGNVKLYDNFNVQKPGRAIYIKLTYLFF